jgi:hypothetical protein
MARMGHSSFRAALIYQHATRDRDVAIAKAIGDIIDAAGADIDPDRVIRERAVSDRLGALVRRSGRQETTPRPVEGE